MISVKSIKKSMWDNELLPESGYIFSEWDYYKSITVTYKPNRPDSELIASWFNAAGFSANSHRRRADVNKKCIALWYIWACLGSRYRTVIVFCKLIFFLEKVFKKCEKIITNDVTL